MSIPEGIECVTVNRKPHPLFGSVLLYAREKCYLRSLEVELIQAPTEANGQMAICAATATFAPPDGEVQVYTDIGDASPASLASAMRPHACRMASTRAMGRALRWGCGITSALYEEVDVGETAAAGNGAPERVPAATRQPATAGREGGTGKFCEFEECGVELHPSELKPSWDSFKKRFCKTHLEQMRRKLATRPAA